MDWNDLKYVLALKRAGTLAGAARELGVDHSTVSRRLAALEEAIGSQLLRRTPEGLCFTDAGNTAAATAEAMAAAASGLLDKLAGADDRDAGVVRLTFPEAFIPFLVEESRQLRDAHPELRVELLPSTAVLDLLRREADVALRMFRPTQAALVARMVGKLGWSLYASEAYVARKGPLQSVGDLSGHELIAYDAELKAGFGPRWLDEHAGSATVVMRCDSVRGAMLAITQGVGIGTIPCYLAGGEPLLRRGDPGGHRERRGLPGDGTRRAGPEASSAGPRDGGSRVRPTSRALRGNVGLRERRPRLRDGPCPRSCTTRGCCPAPARASRHPARPSRSSC